jgi:phosphoglycolate phosphatase
MGLVRIIEETGADRRTAWMVGDSAVDVRTGRAAGVGTCGVTYGYGSAGFEFDPPDVLVERFEDVVSIVGTRPATSGRGR